MRKFQDDLSVSFGSHRYPNMMAFPALRNNPFLQTKSRDRTDSTNTDSNIVRDSLPQPQPLLNFIERQKTVSEKPAPRTSLKGCLTLAEVERLVENAQDARSQAFSSAHLSENSPNSSRILPRYPKEHEDPAPREVLLKKLSTRTSCFSRVKQQESYSKKNSLLQVPEHKVADYNKLKHVNAFVKEV